MIFPEQIRAARGLLGLTQVDLANRAGVGVATVKRIENANDHIRTTVDAMLKIQRALEAAGAVFIDPDDQFGVGVRLRKPSGR